MEIGETVEQEVIREVALEGYKQLLKGYHPTGIRFSGVDIAGMAKAMGIKAATINAAEELEPSLKEGFEAGEPSLIQVPTATVPAPELSHLMEQLTLLSP